MNGLHIAITISLAFGLAFSSEARADDLHLDTQEFFILRDGCIPDAAIMLQGAISESGGNWLIHISGDVNGTQVDQIYAADLTVPEHRHWIGFTPFDSRDALYRVSRQYGDSFIWDAIEGIDMPAFGIVFPDDLALDTLDIELRLCVGEGQDCGTVMPISGGTPDWPEGTLVTTYVTHGLADIPVFRNVTTGEEMTPVQYVDWLDETFGFTREQAVRQIGYHPMTRAEYREALLEGAKRKLAAMIAAGTAPTMEKDAAFAMANEVWTSAQAHAGADYQVFLVDAAEIMSCHGANMDAVQNLLDDSGEQGNPLDTMFRQNQQSSMASRGQELTVTLEAEVEVEVSIPPFVTVKVKAKATVTGPASEYAAVLELANKVAAEAADKLAADLRARVNELKKTAKELAKEVKEFMGSVWDYLWSAAPIHPAVGDPTYALRDGYKQNGYA